MKTVEGAGFAENQVISIYDITEGNRWIANLTTDSAGEDSLQFNITEDFLLYPENWTVGPHLIRLIWDRLGGTVPYTDFGLSFMVQ